MSRRTIWEFPDLERRARTDPSWTATLDSLRRPRKLDEKLAEWRKEALIRPVVFKDPQEFAADTVHLHLQQRRPAPLGAVPRPALRLQRPLPRLPAQSRDSIPRVILLGRLALYGQGAERLHEEMVPVTARWIEPSRREGALRAYARDTETRTLALLDGSLSRHAEQPDAVVRDRLLKAAPADVEALRPQLEQRARALAEDALARLAERGKAEAEQLAEVLRRQRERVIEELARHEGSRQLALDFSSDEAEQLEADKRHWRRRLDSFDRDLAEEPKRIEAFYKVRAQRVEPVGLVYLWPETN